MSSAPESSRVEFLDNWIPRLAELYDGYANAFDPFAEETDRAERVFRAELVLCYDLWPQDTPKPAEDIFRRAVIDRCRKFLKANPPR
jgi:hypothetical protein